MSDNFVGEIRIFAGNFAPKDWAFCRGQLIPISQNTALFSLLGTTYGGNGTSNFALPDLQGRAPMQPGQAPGLSPYALGQQDGAETVTLSAAQKPAHSHPLRASSAAANASDPTGNVLANAGSGALYASGPADTPLSAGAVGPAGGDGLEHNNLMPYLPVNYIIAMTGIFPARS